MKNATFTSDRTGASGVTWPTLLISIACCAAAGLLAERSSWKPEKAQIAAILSGTATYLILESGAHSKALSYSREQVAPRLQQFLAPLIWTSAGAAAVFLLAVSSPVLQASVLNRRLQAALALPDPKARISKAGQVIKQAAKAKVQLKPELVAETIEAIPKTAASNSDWVDIQQSVDLRFQPNVISISASPTTGAVYLDRMSMTDSLLGDEVIVYRGGPLHLKNVRFENVRFEIADNDNGRAFAKVLLTSTEDAVTIDLQ